MIASVARGAFWILLVVMGASCSMLHRESGSMPGIRPRPRAWRRGDEGTGPSYAIYPTQVIPIRFDHARHMNIAGMHCTPCHDRAAQSASAADRLVPPESACTPCHAIDHAEPLRERTPTARCDGCHEGYRPDRPLEIARVGFPASNLVFSHAAHIARGERCEDCHGSMERTSLATRLDLPMMQTCFRCHRDGSTASNACTTCHITRPDGVLQTDFAEGELNPPTWMTGLHHDADFWVTHRFVAAESGDRCATCHTESDCVECHDRRVRDRRLHPNDYVMLHAAEARQSTARCMSCHRMATFCETCHLRIGVAQDSAALAHGVGRFHPPPDVWSGRVVGPEHHAIEARRSLSTCISCHTERDCTSCHGSTELGGAGIDPHPPGWQQRCGLLLHASPRACAQCHASTLALEAQCR